MPIVRADDRHAGLSDLRSLLTITWLGHGTVLVEAAGARLLTDPLLRRRVGPLLRTVPVPALPGEVDAVLVTHVHHDHLDVPSLRLLRSKRLVVPRGAAHLLRRRGFDGVVEVDEGDEVSIGPLTVRATHAVHPTRRIPLAAPTPALGYLVSGPAALYVAGDTDIFDGMRDFAPGLDVALLPVSGWGPRVGPGHLDPERAAEALGLLEPKVAIPIHWGTYRRIGLSRDAATLREPAERFRRRAAELAPEVAVRILGPGERFELE
jgi:L-ascorbate metabolism protein UlaG (beta-lactamase superfamily)